MSSTTVPTASSGIPATSAAHFSSSELPCALVPCGRWSRRLASLVLVVRTRWEDEMLQAKLSRYKEYAQRVRYRLIPGVW